MKPDKEPLEKIEPDSALMQAADRALAKKNPKLAALMQQGVEQVEQDRAQGKFRPLR
jgi:hypothetical protein